MSIVGISGQCQGSENNPAVTGSGDRDLAPEFVRFMGFAFGNAADMGFVKAIDFMFIGFVLKEDAPGIQQGLGIGADLFLCRFADQFTDQSTPDGPQSPGCLFRLFVLLGVFPVGCLTKELGSDSRITLS